MRKSGEVLRIGPGWNNQNGFRSFHLIHRDLSIYRHLHAVTTTFKRSEDTQLGGDRRLSRIGGGKASWSGDHITQAALIAFLAYISFTDLDCLVTIRTWDQTTFSDFNATLQYLPPENLRSNYCEIDGFQFDFVDLFAL